MSTHHVKANQFIVVTLGWATGWVSHGPWPSYDEAQAWAVENFRGVPREKHFWWTLPLYEGSDLSWLK